MQGRRLAIKASVGRGGANVRADVAAIQTVLSARADDLGIAALRTDGFIDDATMSAIGCYQSLVAGRVGVRTGGRIEPNDPMLDRLSDTSAAGLLRDRLEARTVRRNLSGEPWFRSHETRFTDSDRVSDLSPAFAIQVATFLSALRSASATVWVTATRHDRNRAWITYYAWSVAAGEIRPEAVPVNPAVAIHWDHGDPRTSRRAAQTMVDLYGLRSKPSRSSPHVDGTAIDMAIGWDSPIIVRDAAGRAVYLDHPRCGDGNVELHAVGASYGVRKAITRSAYWSADGR